MSRLLFVLFVALLTSGCGAQETCEKGRGIKTPVGRLVEAECSNAKGYTTRQSVYLDQQKVLEDKSLFQEESNKERTIWIYSGKSLHETGCPERLYLIDLSVAPPKVTAFGVKKACNLFHWASWGQKRSVIALKKNVSFVYENGKLSLPAAGEKLWNSIEPPHAGGGMTIEDAVPFAEEIALP